MPKDDLQSANIDPGLANFAQEFDDRMQRAFKGIYSRPVRRQMMRDSLRRRIREGKQA